MVNSIKIKSNYTTYIDSSHPNSDFSKEEKLLVSTIINNTPNFNSYKSLLRFYISDLNLDSLKNIYLFLFIKNIYSANDNLIKIGITGNNDTSPVSITNELKFPKKSVHTQINFNISTQSVGQYIKINVSDVIRALESSTNFYNLIIESLNLTSDSIIEFSSNNSTTPPYLVLINNTDDKNISNIDTRTFSYLSNTNSNGDNNIIENIDDKNITSDYAIDNEHFNMKEIYTKVINELNTQNSRLDSVEKNLTNIISSLGDDIATIKSNATNLDNKLIPTFNTFDKKFSDINNTIVLFEDYIENLKKQNNSSSESISMDSLNNSSLNLNEFIQTEISQLKNSVNNEILELKTFINNDLSNIIKSSIKNIIDNEHFNIKEIYTKVVNELNTQNSRLDSVEKNLTNIINYLDDNIATIKNNTTSLDNKLIPTFNKFDKKLSDINNTIVLFEDYIENLEKQNDSSSKNLSMEFLNNLTSNLHEFTQNEVSQLKDSVNNEILELKTYINNDLYNLKNSIKDMNEILSQLSNPMLKISGAMENMLLGPHKEK